MSDINTLEGPSHGGAVEVWNILWVLLIGTLADSHSEYLRKKTTMFPEEWGQKELLWNTPEYVFS